MGAIDFVRALVWFGGAFIFSLLFPVSIPTLNFFCLFAFAVNTLSLAIYFATIARSPLMREGPDAETFNRAIRLLKRSILAWLVICAFIAIFASLFALFLRMRPDPDFGGAGFLFVYLAWLALLSAVFCIFYTPVNIIGFAKAKQQLLDEAKKERS